MTEDIEKLEEEAEPLDRLEKRLKLLQRYGVRTYRDGRLSIDLAGNALEPKKKPAEDGDSLVRGQ